MRSAYKSITFNGSFSKLEFHLMISSRSFSLRVGLKLQLKLHCGGAFARWAMPVHISL